MKVLKFGGTSVGSVEGLTSVKNIAESAQEAEIIVVSAFSGVTESLLRGASAASEGNITFRSVYDDVCRRHEEMINSLFGESSRRERVSVQVHSLLDELKSLYEGVYALRVIPKKTGDQIASMGERLSSLIIAEFIDGAVRHDSLNFIKTVEVPGRTLLNNSLTEKKVRDEFADAKGISIVPGFIATDSVTGDITTLGRGGSDYTASIIAAALDAGCLEIWTDVNGFMTADPRIVKDSCVIDEISFAEAMELCHFGAKVIYAPALYPVLSKEIPMYIKNTFNPSASGTVVRRTAGKSKAVTGLASIDNMCLLTLSAPSMVGIVGVDNRLFGALKSKNISVFLVTQSSSETGISVGITADAIEKARVAVDEEFASEISSGVMNPSIVEKDLSTVAVVGPDLKMSKGVAAKLFTALSGCGIGILACAQGSSEHNISMVIRKENLHSALNVIHRSFFRSEYRELNLFVCGIGIVGGRLLEQISGQRELLMKEKSLKLNIVGISNSTLKLLDSDGIDLSTFREKMVQDGVSVDTAGLRDGIIGMNLPNRVFVDCTANETVAGLYEDFLSNGISVVAANKCAASSDYDRYRSLKTIAEDRGVKFLFETNVGAGLPVISTINALRNSGDHVERIEAVMSGSLNYIFNVLSSEIPFSRAVRMAKEAGYSEPDPRVDLSGTDVVRKLVILAREAGCKVSQEDVEKHLFIPKDFFEGSLEEFWQRLPSLDAGFEEQRQKLASEGKRWRFVARMDKGHYGVALETVGEEHPLYHLDGSTNIFILTTARYRQYPMIIKGYGAGADVTAAGVFSDILKIANI